ncbi:MAG TPA: FtsQ-type POTRA domain-containing protein [Candidatus Acetothermia bacterium]|nr:FtsQ-type POTRA domain-containing protein [Candidatus Acetothermia bacterium]
MNEGEPRSAVRWAAVIGGILIAAAIIALYTPWVRIFDLRKIVVKGNYYTSTSQVEASCGIRNGVNLLRAPLKQARASLLQLPWIMNASLRRILPHTLEITVRERTPIALVIDSTDSSRMMVLGKDGVIVGYARDASAQFVHVSGVSVESGPSGKISVNGDVTRTLIYLRKQGLGRDLFPRIDFSNSSAVTMYTVDGGKVVLGPSSDIEERIDELKALLRTIDLADYQMIDLRFGGEARLVPRKVVNR